MLSQSSLVVPVQVQAMVVNNANMNFIRAQMNYQNLDAYNSPSPTPFQTADIYFAGETANQGVYVMWTLPAALRHAVRDAGGVSDFPLVPNRWLVVRLYRPEDSSPTAVPQAQSWVVQSDMLNSPNLSSSVYLDPTAAKLKQTLLGQQVPIAPGQPWQEPGLGDVPYFLRAVAESNVSFAAYQPFNQNVFSIFDDLATLDVGAGTLSYFVLGWYSEAAADILSNWTPGSEGEGFKALLARLQWLVDDADDTTTASLYEGMVFGVPWLPNATSPPASPANGANPQVAVANTSIDALVAFAEAALAAEPPQSSPPDFLTPRQASDLLEAFQYDLLQLLAVPGAADLLELTIRGQWFGSTAAGRAWVIVNASDDASPSSPPTAGGRGAEEAAEDEWLPELNDAQERFDWKARELMGVQRRIFELHWKHKCAKFIHDNPPGPYPTGTSSAEFKAALDPDTPGGLLQTARELIRELAHLAAHIPHATANVSLDEAILDFATAKGLPPWRVLKAVAQPRFWEPNDPVLLISGTAGGLSLDTQGALWCRWPEQSVSALDVNAGAGGPAFMVSTQQLNSYLPDVPWTNLPADGPSLFQEFFLLDPTNAPILAAAADYNDLTETQLTALAASMSPPRLVSESPPSSPPSSEPRAPSVLAPYPWAQPWQPLFLDWEIMWYPVTYPNWSFDGLDYGFDYGSPPEPLLPQFGTPLMGRSLLTPKPSFQFKARLEQYIRDHPDSRTARLLQELEGLIESVEQWDFMSQAMSGLTTLVSGWNPVPVQQPDATKPVFDDSPPCPLTWADLVGQMGQAPPNPGEPNVQTVVPSTFEGLRGGLFYINQLTVVDAFGQTLEIVEPPDTLTPYPHTLAGDAFVPLVGDGMESSVPVPLQESLSFLQLPPRLLQPARLNFEFTPASTDGNPILGWVLPNHLDLGLSIYGTDGAAYGELRPAVDAAGVTFVNWANAWGSPYPDLAALTAAQAQLGGFLTALQAAGPGAFGNFLRAVDETLWTVAPPGNQNAAYLSSLMGRPMALAAASLSFELQSQALWDTGWPYTFWTQTATGYEPPAPIFLGYEFPVRLGDLGYQLDGLLGYFLGGSFTQFNAVHVPSELAPDPSNYLAAVAPGNYVNCSFAAEGRGPSVPLVMLADPRAAVHAQCALVPMQQLSLRPEWVDASLKAMRVTFRTGPALVAAPLIIPDGPTQTDAPLQMSGPSERHGRWSWVELESAGRLVTMPLAPVDESAAFPSTPPTLREGLLQLSGGLDD